MQRILAGVAVAMAVALAVSLGYAWVKEARRDSVFASASAFSASPAEPSTSGAPPEILAASAARPGASSDEDPEKRSAPKGASSLGRSILCVTSQGADPQREGEPFPAALVDSNGLLVAVGPAALASSGFLVHVQDGRGIPAARVAEDQELDLVLLRMEPDPALEVLAMSAGPGPAPGEPVEAITCSRDGLDRSAAIVAPRTSPNDPADDLIRTDLLTLGPRSAGGGPLLNARGECVGFLKPGTAEKPKGTGLAIPAARGRALLERWREGRGAEKSEQEWIDQCQASSDAAARKRCYEEALNLRPQLPKARYHLAQTLQEIGDSEGRLRALEEVVRSLPRFMDARRDLILARTDSGDWKGAGEVCTESLTIEARDARLLVACAEVDRRLDRCYSALYKADEAVELDPGYPQAYLNRALIYGTCLGRCDAAVKDYRKYLDLDPRAARSQDLDPEIRHCQSDPRG